jgi:O-methyltransferase involved in polyketide biosynthesis
MTNENQQPDVKRISFTGDSQAHFKTFYGLPYAQEIYDLTQDKKVDYEEFSKNQKRIIIPVFEARFKSSMSTLESLVKGEEIFQIYEMASGLSSMGLIMTDRYPQLLYVETDLPEMIRKKEGVVLKIQRYHKKPEQIAFYPADARTESATHLLRKKPVIVYMEGLLSYYDTEGKAQILQNAGNILRRFGGHIITPDLAFDKERFRFLFEATNLREMQRQIEQQTGRSYEENAFDNQEQIDRFLDEQGFSIRKLSPTDYDLETFASLNIPPEAERVLREDIERNAKVRILSLKE